jgi:type IV pilus assembly protein PilA
MKAAIDTQNGFTLIELMAVVAIVSILSMVAMATYADYVTRSKVGEGLVFASEAKTSVTEYYYNNQKWPKNNSQAGLPAADSYDQNFEYIKSLEVATSEPFCDRMKLKELTVAFRAYCEPKTKTGPSYGEILFDRVILFRRP